MIKLIIIVLLCRAKRRWPLLSIILVHTPKFWIFSDILRNTLTFRSLSIEQAETFIRSNLLLKSSIYDQDLSLFYTLTHVTLIRSDPAHSALTLMLEIPIVTNQMFSDHLITELIMTNCYITMYDHVKMNEREHFYTLLCLQLVFCW